VAKQNVFAKVRVEARNRTLQGRVLSGILIYCTFSFFFSFWVLYRRTALLMLPVETRKSVGTEKNEDQSKLSLGILVCFFS
jgi:hypothetical protein